jgi:hypothetical protein
VNFDIIKNYLVVYLAEIAIPYFRNSKMKDYKSAMTNFSVEEIINSQKNSECWTHFVENVRQIEF